MSEKRLTYNVEEVAVMLGIGRTLAYELVRRGEIPGVLRFGKRVVIAKYQFDHWLEGREVSNVNRHDTDVRAA